MILMFLLSGRRSPGRMLAGIVAGAFALTGCGSGPGFSSAGEQVQVVAAFYPLQYVAERVVGDHAEVTNLTRPGVEPHDLELTPRDVATVDQAALVVYLKGFQPAVDQAIEQAGGNRIEVSDLAGTDLPAQASHEEPSHEEPSHEEPGHEEPGHEEPGHEEPGHEESGDDGQAVDPHFWLDPLRLADVADGVAERMSDLDRPHADTYERNAAKLRSDLDALDQEFESGLADCRNRELVTSHTAFGYLAKRYRFHQVGVTGLSPEEEPSPAKMSEVARFVRTHDVGTIYYETLASPTLTQTLARETGAKVAVLDPVEGLTDKSAGTDYLAVMRANLRTLQKGQGC
jgi:zinc transport system substrate-binding protein